MHNTTQAGATAPRLYTLYDLWDTEVARLVCTPAELPAALAAAPVFGLTPAHRQQLTELLSEMGGTGCHSARTALWRLTSEPIHPAVLTGALALALGAS